MIALLVVALSVSMAAAVGFTINPDPIQLQDEGFSTFTVYWDGDDPITADWDVLTGAFGTTSDLQIKTGTDDFGSTGTQVFAAKQTITYTLKDGGGTATGHGDTYYIQFSDGMTPCRQMVTVTVELIPEFATIAIPAIALLGLVFFMRRKEQK